MAIHDEPHALAGQQVTVQLKARNGCESPEAVTATVEDYWDRVSGKSWMFSEGNPAALAYAFRSGSNGLPIDNEVLYTKINGMGELVHTSEVTE